MKKKIIYCLVVQWISHFLELSWSNVKRHWLTLKNFIPPILFLYEKGDKGMKIPFHNNEKDAKSQRQK